MVDNTTVDGVTIDDKVAVSRIKVDGVAAARLTVDGVIDAVGGYILVAGALPAGLTFDANTGVISGNVGAGATVGTTTYTIQATGPGGLSNTATFDITVNAAVLAPNITCAGNQSFTNGVAITAFNIVAGNTGGAIVTYGIAPGLPAGLTLNTATGVVSGTPTAVSANTTYTVSATNGTGTDNCTFDIEVQAALAAPNITCAGNQSFTNGVAITAFNSVATNTGGAIATYAVAPALPAGLTLNTGTGVISGTPTAVSANTTYTITATNASGNDTCTFDIVVAAGLAAPNITCVGNQTFADGTSVGTVNSVASNSGGAIASYAIAPALPAGLAFNTATGAITGTPSGGASGPTTYTVTATNAAGSDNCTFDIEVTAAAAGVNVTLGHVFSTGNAPGPPNSPGTIPDNGGIGYSDSTDVANVNLVNGSIDNAEYFGAAQTIRAISHEFTQGRAGATYRFRVAVEGNSVGSPPFASVSIPSVGATFNVSDAEYSANYSAAFNYTNHEWEYVLPVGTVDEGQGVWTDWRVAYQTSGVRLVTFA